MASRWVAWTCVEVPHAISLDQLSPVDKLYEVKKGVPRAHTFPTDAKFTVDKDFPNSTLLVDALETVYDLTVVSPRLKEFIAAREPRNVEYLPVTILNHKRRPAAQYFILNPVHPVECLDLSASGAEWDVVANEVIDQVERIVIDESKVDDDLLLFKPKFLYRVIIVRRDLAEAITSERFTGVEWTELEEYGSS
jgi:hypothetical protein